MAPHQLFGDGLHDVAEVESVLLLRHAGMEDDLQQQIAELVAQIGEVVARDGVGHLIGLFERVRRNGREVLLEVPWTAGTRRPQRRHDLQEPGNIA